MSDEETTVKILKDARSILMAKGWTKGHLYHRINGCYCLLGAIGSAYGIPDVRLQDGSDYNFIAAQKPVTVVAKYLLDVEEYVVPPIVCDCSVCEDARDISYDEVVFHWNDSSGQTQEGVIKLLDNVISSLEKENQDAR